MAIPVTIKLGSLLRRVRMGHRLRCPVCDGSLKHFLPLPAFYLDEARKHGFPCAPDDFETLNHREYSCPRCKSSDRDRLYALYLDAQLPEWTSGGRKLRLLDIAPAAALSRKLKSDPRIAYRSADLFMPDVDDHVSLTDLHCYEDGRFDFVICSHVLEHVPDDRAALRELHRVIAVGGHAIIMVPLPLSLAATQYDPAVDSDAERWRRYGQNDHVRLYAKADFLARLANAGFEIDALGVDWFGADQMKSHGIEPRSVLYVVRK